jgi:hypothetical protein
MRDNSLIEQLDPNQYQMVPAHNPHDQTELLGTTLHSQIPHQG